MFIFIKLLFVTLCFEKEIVTTVAAQVTTVTIVEQNEAQNKSSRIGEAQGLDGGKRCAAGTWDSNMRNMGDDCQFLCNCDGDCDDMGSCLNKECPEGWKG